LKPLVTLFQIRQKQNKTRNFRELEWQKKYFKMAKIKPFLDPVKSRLRPRLVKKQDNLENVIIKRPFRQRFKCKECDNICSNSSDLSNHNLISHRPVPPKNDSEKILCDICGHFGLSKKHCHKKTVHFTETTNFENGLISENICDICYKFFCGFEELQLHKSFVHRIEQPEEDMSYATSLSVSFYPNFVTFLSYF
jgi:hypothetical protein